MKKFEAIALITKTDDKNKNLNWTDRVICHFTAASIEDAKKRACRVVFDKTGYFVGRDKIAVKLA